MQSWADWLEQRLGYRLVTRHLRNRILPDGPSWAFTSASCLFWLLIIQCFTGLLLMATYSPSMTSAWASVHFIDQSSAGRFLRGVHHYASHAMIILFGIHVLRVLITGAYRAPRELVWITGLMLFPLVIIWTVTGNPLSASQKGIAQIQVEGNILAGTPVIGPFLQRVLFGGEEVGILTLTRLYFLHVGLLPLLIGGLTVVHLYQVLKHSPYQSPTEESPASGALTYWPYQSSRNMVTLALVMSIVGWLAWQYGAPLYAPADPDLVHTPRPEWYFRWLFELRRYFSGNTEFVATMVIPSAFLFGFMAVPFLDRFRSPWISTVCRVLVVAACAGGWGWLTALSYLQDWKDASYLAHEAEFEAISERALELAQTEPITEQGAVMLLRNDPQTQGPRLFARHCVSCHSHADPQGHGLVAAEPSAPNLYGIGTTDWIAGFLEPGRASSDSFFGKTKFREGDMVQHVTGLFSEAGEAGQEGLKQKLRSVAAALAAEAAIESPEAALVTAGREALISSVGCTDCHRFHDQGELGSAPDLTGYGSANWLKQMIAKPTAERFYSDRNDRMPEFAADESHPELNLISPHELDLLVRWLRTPAPTKAP